MWSYDKMNDVVVISDVNDVPENKKHDSWL